MLMTVFCRVEIKSDRIEITLSRGRLTQLLTGSIDLKMQFQEPTNFIFLLRRLKSAPHLILKACLNRKKEKRS
jgi:hypothetical protein